MKIAITGASGFLGRRLVERLAASGHDLHLLGRSSGGRTTAPAGARRFVWQPMEGPPGTDALAGCHAVIHLAGEPVSQRWSAEVKRRIRESRIIGTRNLVTGIAAAPAASRPAVLVSASAVGYYGDRGDEVLTESSAPGSGFLPEVCAQWEQEALTAQTAAGTRVALIRTGLVLGIGGGALEKMLPPFRLGFGGRLGSGRQWMPWIHIDDLCALFTFAALQSINGPLNGAAPNPVSNRDFTRALGRALFRPAIVPVPRLAVELMFGEMAQIVFASQRAVPRAAEAAGFRFTYPELGPALESVLR